jgi:hypothetical protein
MVPAASGVGVDEAAAAPRPVAVVERRDLLARELQARLVPSLSRLRQRLVWDVAAAAAGAASQQPTRVVAVRE